MIVTEKLGFIAHPNTGSRSIREVLEYLGGEEKGGYHEVHQPTLLTHQWIACTIRNPWDLMASWYFRTMPGMEIPFPEWLPMTFDGLRHYEGPGNRLFYGFRDSNLVMRFEHLQEDFDHVMWVAGHQPINLGHLGRTKRPVGYRGFYGEDKLIRMVEWVYAEQIEMGGYKF